MNAVGIDVSKGKSMVAILRPGGQLVRNAYEKDHRYGALESLAYSPQALGGRTARHHGAHGQVLRSGVAGAS